MPAKSICLTVTGIVLPFVLVSLYLYFSRYPVRWFTGNLDQLALGAAIGIGVTFLSRLPVPLRSRLILMFAYVPPMAIALIIYSLMFVGCVFNDWL